MTSPKSHYSFSSDGVSFTSNQLSALRLIYFPLCGIDSRGIKSSITPFLSGDIKMDKNRYLTKPVSREDLRNGVRNFFVCLENNRVISLAQPASESPPCIEIGPLWHRMERVFPQAGLKIKALNFVPSSGEPVELMRITVENNSDKNIKFIPTAAVPIFGRALANKHDHEHVTALLQRIEQIPQGVIVSPTLLFNEEGHLANHSVYYVYGVSDKNEMPVGSFPMVESFYGEGGDWSEPEALMNNAPPRALAKELLSGREAMGALRFKEETLAPGKEREYLFVLGIAESKAVVQSTFEKFNSTKKFDAALEQNKTFWAGKIDSIQLKTGDEAFNAWIKWVTIQPVLRRIFGNSFLPDHDYGKGGKGWRDLWQDLLSLILIEPENVRETLVNNFAGVRIDGTNATIIGSVPGEFIADRNAITRVWMDHGAWPFLTTLLYIDQTGDYSILLEQNAYFRDPQLSRTFEKDSGWSMQYGQKLKDKKGDIYSGTVLEHILIQHLVQFLNVGEHNLIRLESADWNDGLDMAFHRGESVAFMSFYGGNLLSLANLLTDLAKWKGIKKITLAQEVLILLDSLSEKECDYNKRDDKEELLFKRYFKAVQPEVSGKKEEVLIADVIKDLKKKGQWIFRQIRKQEWTSVQDKQQTYQWFNGYYDNHGERVEGKKDEKVWMTLTGQVFPVMSGLATPEEIQEIVKSVNRFLKDPQLGGIRLNTDFGLDHYLNFGRAFGFAYGTKENGAFFSHMNVMYAYALYKRGFVHDGYAVLQSIYRMCIDTEKSKIYPGIPEYFDSLGRGMYHYLTGSASWLILTQLTQVFGVQGDRGDLVLAPKLLLQEFDQKGEARVRCYFAGKKLEIIYVNQKKIDFGKYSIKSVSLNQTDCPATKISEMSVKIKREVFEKDIPFCSLKVILA